MACELVSFADYSPDDGGDRWGGDVFNILYTDENGDDGFNVLYRDRTSARKGKR